MLVVSDASLAAERVSGTRTKVASKNTRGEMSVLFGALSTRVADAIWLNFWFHASASYALQRQPKRRRMIKKSNQDSGHR